MTYELKWETAAGEPRVETFDLLDDSLDRASNLAIQGLAVVSLIGPEGFFSHDLIDAWMYRKLDASDMARRNARGAHHFPSDNREMCAIPPPKLLTD